MGMGFSSRKSPKMPGAHKIGAAISGPRITGRNFMDTTLSLNIFSEQLVRQRLPSKRLTNSDRLSWKTQGFLAKSPH